MPAQVFEFGCFRLDSGRFELLRDGRGVKLERKPLELLLLLVQSNGNLVTRDEIAQKLWDSEVFVDTEHGINTAVRKIRLVLNDDSEAPRFIQTVPGMGYRFIAAVTALSGTGAEPLPHEEPPPPSASEPAIPTARPRARRWFALAFGAITLAAILVVALAFYPPAARLLHRDRPAIASIAVLPLENLSGDPSQNYFADGMTDELITMLAKNSTLRITSRTSVMQYKDAHRPLPEIARALGVDGILEGSISRSPDKIHLTLQLIRADTDTHLWADSYDRDAADVSTLPAEAAHDIAARLQSSVPAPATPRPVNPAAHDAYLRGRYFYEKREAGKSAAYFQQAISLDPNWSSAYSGLAAAVQSEALFNLLLPADAASKGETAARRALELDPNNGEAYSILGLIQATLQWKWNEAESNLKRGIALSPNSSNAELDYAIYLDGVNRPQEAVAHMRRALQLDPQSFLMNRHLGSTLYFARHYDEALVHLNQAAEMEPGKPQFVQRWVAEIYEMKDMRNQAVNAELLQVQALSPASVPVLRAAYEREGWSGYWKARLKIIQSHNQDLCTQYDAAVAYLHIGKPDLAYPLFAEAIDRKCYEAVWLKVDPLVDPIRNDKRYNDLLERLHLPPDEPSSAHVGK